MKRYSFVQQLEDVIRSASFIVLGMLLMAGVGHVMASPTSAPPDNSALAPKFSELTISNTLDVGEGITVGEGISVGGQLAVSGYSTFFGAEFESDVLMMGGLHVDDDIDVDGDITARDFNVGGTLYFDGEAFDPNANGGDNAQDPTNGDFEQIQALEAFFDTVGVTEILNVTGDAIFGGIVQANGQVNVSGPLTATHTGDAGVVGLNQEPLADTGGVFGGVRPAWDDYWTGSYLGYYDDDGSVYSFFTQGVAKIGELITDRLFTDSIETTGHLDIEGGVTARDFGVYNYYYASIADNQGTVITQGCPDEILIACSGYSSSTKTNYKGTFMNNSSEQGLVCQSERTDQRGTLWVMAYCHNPTELPNNP